MEVTVLYLATTPAFTAGYNLTRHYHSDVKFVNEQGVSGVPFKTLFESTVAVQSSSLLALFVDDIVFISDLLVDGTESALDVFSENDPVLTLSLRLHPGITFCYAFNKSVSIPPLHQVMPEASWSVWEWGGPQDRGDWTFPMSLDGNVYRKQELLLTVQSVDYHNPNTLEFNMVLFVKASTAAVTQPLMMGFHTPVLVNVPVNRVQKMHVNRFNSKYIQSNRDLNIRYLQKERLALLAMAAVKHLLNSVHIDVSLTFESMFPGESYIPWGFLYVAMNSQAGDELFATEANSNECVDEIYVQGHSWFWSVRDSLQYRTMCSQDYSRYVLMLDLLGDDEHSLRSFVTLQEELRYEEMPALEARFDMAMQKLVILQGTHRAAILLHRHFIGLPAAKVKIWYSPEAIEMVRSSVLEGAHVVQRDVEKGTLVYKLPYHAFRLGENIFLRGQRNTSHFIQVVSRHIDFDNAHVLEIGGGFGGNLMTLVSLFNLSCGVGILDSPRQVATANNISHQLLPWARLGFHEHSSAAPLSLLGAAADHDAPASAVYDVLLINSMEFEEADWERVCQVYLPCARVAVLDSVDENNIDIGLRAIARCGRAQHASVNRISLSSSDEALLDQPYLYFIAYNDV